MIEGKKIAAVYNVWDGEELLLGSIQQIAPYIDEVILISQRTSNFNEQYTGGQEMCDSLSHNNDRIYHYRYVDMLGGAKNEKAKRQKGLELAKEFGCDIIIQLDCDEYYRPEEFERCLKRFIASGFDGSYCNMRTFYKQPDWQLSPTEDYYVPLFHRLEPDTKTGQKYPVLVDPTRGLSGKTFLQFNRSEIEMFHYSFVRKDIRRKLRNSSARPNFERDIEKHALQHDNAKVGDRIDYFGLNKQLVQVKNHFDIQI